MNNLAPRTNVNIDLLSKNIRTLNLSRQNLTELPDLTRFRRLKNLHCSYNKLTSIDNLPYWIENIYCSYNQITCINKLPQYLTGLFCGHNKIKYICTLPVFLSVLHCQNNKLVCLSDLPYLCEVVLAYNNELQSIPYLPYGLTEFYCTITPMIYPEINFHSVNIINNFRFNYFTLKYGHKLLFYLLRKRNKKYKKELLETSAKMLMNPKHISQLLENGIELEYIYNNL
jgi:Leucine-rich repeat (LRR) protein